MDFETAMAGIIDALGDKVSDYDEHLGVIRDKFSEMDSTTSTDYKKMYDDLHKKYVARFKELFRYSGNETSADDMLDDALPGEQSVDISDIDFDFDGASE